MVYRKQRSPKSISPSASSWELSPIIPECISKSWKDPSFFLQSGFLWHKRINEMRREFWASHKYIFHLHGQGWNLKSCGVDTVFRKDPPYSVPTSTALSGFGIRAGVFKLSSPPLPVSYVEHKSPINSESWSSEKKMTASNTGFFFHFEIFYVYAKIFWCGNFLWRESWVLRRLPGPSRVTPLGGWPFPPKEAVTVWPEFSQGAKEHRGGATLVKCGDRGFTVSCLWTHQPHHLLWLPRKTPSQLEFSCGSTES